MQFSKLIATSALLLGMAPVSFAGHYSPPRCTPGSVTVDCLDIGWDARFDALFDETNNSDPVYAIQTNNVTGEQQYLTNNPNHRANFELALRAHFGRGSAAQFVWQSVDTQIKSSNAVNAGSDLSLTPYLMPNNIDTQNVAIDVDDSFKMEHFFALFSQELNIDSDLDLRLQGGMAYARFVANRLYITRDLDTPSTSPEYIVRHRSKFDAVGAVAGGQAVYNFSNCFALVGEFNFTLYSGDITTWMLPNIFDGDTNPSLGMLPYTQETDDTVVPELYAKVGVRGTLAVYGGDISIEGGWHFQDMMGSFKYSNRQAAAYSDLVMQGPYVAIQFFGE